MIVHYVEVTSQREALSRHDDLAIRSRVATILDAAVEAFAAYGFARTTMSVIAESAGVSRAGLYLHFDNKEAVYRAMLDRTLLDARSAAFASLEEPGSTAAQLDGYLQRGWGDPGVWALTAKHGADMIEAKAGYASDVAAAHNATIHDVTVGYLMRVAPNASESAHHLLAEVLMLSPVGLRYDKPPIERYRERLSELATMVANQIEAESLATTGRTTAGHTKKE